jgi:hypothetical protein
MDLLSLGPVTDRLCFHGAVAKVGPETWGPICVIRLTA